MAKLTLNDVQNLENSETAKNTINNNNTLLETTVERVLFRDGTNPNHMTADLDMNSNRILNLPAPVDPTEPIRKKEGDNFVGFQETVELTAAVEAAEAAAVTATDQAALAKKWATNPEDVPVTTPPDEFSAMHWAKKAQASVAPFVAPFEFLTADKIWYVALKDNAYPGSSPGNDVTGDGTFAKPWHSVNKAISYITSRVICNGFAPVIQMFPGHYNAKWDDPQASYFAGVTPPGFNTWGANPDTPTCSNTYDFGGSIVELCEPLLGKQGTGGQPIRLCSLNDTDPISVIITTYGVTPISVLHMGKLILSNLSFQVVPYTTPNLKKCEPDPTKWTINYASTIYATQGGAIEVGNNIVNLGAAGHFMVADSGGSVIQTGAVKMNAGSALPGGAAYAYASGGGSTIGILGDIDFQWNQNGTVVPDPAPPIWGTTPGGIGFVTATQGGRVSFQYKTIHGALSAISPKYLANLGGGIAGIGAGASIGLDDIPGGTPGAIQTSPGVAYAWGL